MPLVLDSRSSLGAAPASTGVAAPRATAARTTILDIGLLNNMPDGALKATERHYVDLLSQAAGAATVRLHLFSVPEVPRSQTAQSYIDGVYSEFGSLRGAGLDALIVTGAEPRADSLVDEPYWANLAGIVDWAEHSTLSTLWSCLAAHAAVLHLDGIDRQKLGTKRSGLFECVKAAEAPLLAGTPTVMRIPHSRWNDLDEAALRSHGYRVLSRSMEAGIDCFAKQWRSLFVYFQGHPEYAADTLYREYRRDVQRFLNGSTAAMPDLPRHYFDQATEQRFCAFAAEAEAVRAPATFDRFPRSYAVRQPMIECWRASAVQIFRNWLDAVSRAKG